MEYLNNVIFEDDGEIMKWKVVEVDESTTLIEFELKRNLEPGDLNVINLPDPIKLGFSSKLVVVSGRGPIWLYSFITHRYHIVKALAVYDPRFSGAIIVASHDTRYKEGEIIRVDLK